MPPPWAKACETASTTNAAVAVSFRMRAKNEWGTPRLCGRRRFSTNVLRRFWKGGINYLRSFIWEWWRGTESNCRHYDFQSRGMDAADAQRRILRAGEPSTHKARGLRAA